MASDVTVINRISRIAEIKIIGRVSTKKKLGLGAKLPMWKLVIINLIMASYAVLPIVHTSNDVEKRTDNIYRIPIGTLRSENVPYFGLNKYLR